MKPSADSMAGMVSHFLTQLMDVVYIEVMLRLDSKLQSRLAQLMTGPPILCSSWLFCGFVRSNIARSTQNTVPCPGWTMQCLHTFSQPTALVGDSPHYFDRHYWPKSSETLYPRYTAAPVVSIQFTRTECFSLHLSRRNLKQCFPMAQTHRSGYRREMRHWIVNI